MSWSRFYCFQGVGKKKGKKVREGRGEEGRIISFLGLLEQSTHKPGLNTTEMYCLMVLDTSSLKSRCWQGHDPPSLSWRNHPHLLWFLIVWCSLVCSSKIPVPISLFTWLPPLCVYALPNFSYL